MSLVLALDQGGTASRALVVGEAGEVLVEARRPVATQRAGEDRVEHDPHELLRSVREAAAEAVAGLGARAGELSCAALATQRSSIACWDRQSGAPLAPVLSWQDRRAAADLARLADRADAVRARTGLPLSPHYGASKLSWCLARVPAVAAAARDGRLACGPLASFLLHGLLRERPLLADPANAARTLLWDRHAGDWSPELAALFGVPLAALPACAPTRHAFGTLPLPGRDLPLVACTGDASAALFAAGPPARDDAHVVLGTGAFLQRVAGGTPPPVGSLLASVVAAAGGRTLHVLEGTVNGGAAALAAVAAERGLDEPDPEHLQRALSTAEDPPLFLNGVSGLGSPWWRSDFRSRFLRAPRDDDDALAGVLESIVFLLAVNLREMDEALGRTRALRVAGGLSRLDALCLRLAAVTGRPVVRPRQGEATCLGLAVLARAPDDRLPGAGDGAPTAPAPDGGRDADAFEPRAHPACERFARWRLEMERALG